jgi:hypothetical protein
MSLHHIAKQVAAKGRDEDTMLIHMTPSEVAGLQQIAMAAGGSLTVNPDTGLAEAGFLKSLLPMLAGGIATFFTGGMAAPLLAGAATGALTGDKRQSLLMRAGLGALGGFGGAGISTALAGTGATAAGASSLGGEAAKTAAGKAMEKAAVQKALETTGGVGIKQAAQQAASRGVGTYLSNIGTGIGQLGGEAGRNAIMSAIPGGKLGLAAGLAPSALAAATPPPIKGSKEVPPEYQMYSYNPGTVNPNFGQPGEPYFIGQGYSAPRVTNQNPYGPTYASYDKKGKPVGPAGLSPFEQYMRDMQMQQQPPIAAAEGGALNDYIAGMNEGKATSDPVGMNLNDYMANMNQQRAMNSSPMQYRPPNMTPVGDFTVRNPASGFRGLLTGMMDYQPQARMAQGGITSIGGYSDGGRLLRGPGDGVSDDIPATIHRDDGSKQEARLADGEFVFPARIVSEIGNGSTEAGAQKLYAVMDRIQKDRAGTLKDVAKDTNAIRHVESLA